MRGASPKAVGLATLFLILLPLGSTTALTRFYQWEDEQGVVNMTDDLKNVPEEYRDRAKEMTLPTEERPESSAPSPPSRPERPIKHPEEVDFQGRNREWWRKRAGAWREKRDKAARQFARDEERLNAIPMNLSLRARERERRKILREMENDRERVREAERMLNEVLPEEARKAGAPPGWLRE